VAWGYYSIKDYFEAKLNFNNFVLIDGDDQVAQLDLVNDAIAPSYSSVEGLLITPGFDNTLYFPRFNKQALYDPGIYFSFVLVSASRFFLVPEKKNRYF